MTDILALGEPMVEFNRTGERLYLQGFGGDTSNAAIAAARQGAKVGYISAVGQDRYGEMLRDLWAREGVDASLVRSDPDAFTAVYFVDHDAAGHHFTFLRKGSAASRMMPAHMPLARIAQAKILHLSGISAAISASACDACFAAVDAARSAGVTVSFDTNLRLALWPIARARGVMREFIRLSDICLPSYEDIRAISGLEEPEALIDFCLGLGAKSVALKLGDEGAWLADDKRRERIAPHPCKPVDATGAGDVFAGALLARLVQGDAFEAAGRYASVAAALSTEGRGAVEPIPTAAQVRAAIEKEHA